MRKTKDENMEQINLEGNILEGYAVPTANTSILLKQGSARIPRSRLFFAGNGEKVGDAAVIVTGVKNFENMLAAKVKAVSPAAAALGITTEMNGRQALLKLIRRDKNTMP